MKTLEEFNMERTLSHNDLNSNKPRKNGIACPKCGLELWDSSPMYVYASLPPQLDVNCDCGYSGYRVK